MNEQDTLHRVLGRGDVIAVAFGAMIGFGWIVLTGTFLNNAGTLGAALAFVIGGVVVAFVGLTYAELVSAMPTVGGEHNYTLRAMGSKASFITSWSLVLGYLSVVAFEAVALPQTVSYVFPDMLQGKLWTIAGYDVYATWVAVGVVAAIVMTWLNYIGVRPAALVQGILVIFLAGTGAALLVGAFVGGSGDNMQPLFSGGAAGFVSVLVATPFLYVGFDVIPQSAEEINLPYRKIGQLLLISVGLAVLWYTMIMLTVGSALPAGQLANSNLAAADGMAKLWSSQAMGTVLVLGGIAGILTSWIGFLIGASRLIFAMARSGMIPAWFGELHPRYRTPGNAILFCGVLSVAAPFFGRRTLVWLVDAGGLTIIVGFFMVALSFIVLRRTQPTMERPFRAPGGLFTGVVAAALAAGMGILYLPGLPAALVWPAEWVIFLAWWVVGAVFLAKLPRTRGGPQAEEELLDKTKPKWGVEGAHVHVT